MVYFITIDKLTQSFIYQLTWGDLRRNQKYIGIQVKQLPNSLIEINENRLLVPRSRSSQMQTANRSRIKRITMTEKDELTIGFKKNGVCKEYQIERKYALFCYYDW